MHHTDDNRDRAALIEQLRATARLALAMNWSPYTGAVVMAAVRTTSGACFGGSNVEVSNISLSKHAEECAVLAALSAGLLRDHAGEAHRQFITAVYTTAPPCGSCRQFLYEFATDDCVVYIDDDDPHSETLRDLLPRAFGPDEQAALQRHDEHGQA